MNAHFFSTRVGRLMLVPLLVCGLLALMALSISGAPANAASLHSYGSDPQLRWITVTASGGVVVSDTQPNQAPASGSKTVYFNDLVSGTIIVTPDVTGTAPLTVTRAKGLDGTTWVSVSAMTAPLIQPMPDGPITLAGSQDVTFTLQSNPGTGSGSFVIGTVFRLSFAEDIVSPMVGIIAPATAGQVLTRSAQLIPTYTIEMTATDAGGSGIQSVQIITGAGVSTGNGQWTYDWILPTEDNVTHTLLMTATDYVGNSTTASRSVTVDTQGPSTTGVALTPSHAINTWLPASTIVMTWTGFSDASGIGRYLYLWDTSAGTVITPGTSGTASTANPTASQSLTANGDYYFHVTALDANGNWSSTVVTGPFKIDTDAPTGSFNNPASGWVTATSNLLISGTASDASSDIQQVQVVTGTGGPIQTAMYLSPTWSYTWTMPAENGVAHTLLVTITDKAGNVLALTQPITVDNVGPNAVSNLTSTTHLTGIWSNKSTITMTWVAASDNGGSGLAGYATVWDTSPTTVAPPVSTAGAITTQSSVLSDNANWYYHIKAVDALGNWSSQWGDLGPFKIDSTSPLATVIAAPAYFSTTSGSNITLTYRAIDVLSGLKQVDAYYSLNGGATWTSTNQTKAYSTYTTDITDTLAVPVAGLADGVYAWKVVATDNLGNTPGAPTGSGDIATIYDTHAPVIGSVTAPLDTSVSPINVSWAASDSPAGIQSVSLWVRNLPDDDWAVYSTTTTSATSGTLVYTPDDYGTYDFYVQVADQAGNIMPPPGAPQASTRYGSGIPETLAGAVTPYTNIKPLSIIWLATNTAPNLNMITLCVSSTLSPAWQSIPITTLVGTVSQANGVAPYTPPTDDIYYFAIGASTHAGQQKRCPTSGTGDVSIIYDTQTSAPISLTVTPSGWTNHNLFTLTWSNPADLSSINNVKYLSGSTPPANANVGQSIGLTTTTVVTAPNQGLNTLWLWVEDRAGNSGYTQAQSVILKYDSISPTVMLTMPKTFLAQQATVTWAGNDTNSGLVSYTLEYVGSDNSSNSYTLPATETAKTIPITYDKTYTVTLTGYDGAGNYARTTGSVMAVRFKVGLPIIANTYWTCTSVDAEPNNDYAHAQSLTAWNSTPGGRKLTASGNLCTTSDQSDYFKITPANNSLSLKLSVPAGTNLNLYGYDQSGTNQVFSAIAPAGNKSLVVLLPTGSGAPYYLEVRRMDTVINQYHAQPYTLEVSDIKTLSNGSFEDGAGNTVTDWTLSNAGLPAAPVTSMPDTALFGSRAVLLGDPNLGCESMPLGYAEVKQTFFVPNVSQSLNLKYRYVVFTQDTVGATPELSPSQYDRFEVYVQDAATNTQLAASDANTAKASRCSPVKRVPGAENTRAQDGNWAVKNVSLDAYKGQSVTVIFRNYSRFDNYYNTYTYLDKVELVSP